MKIDLEAEDLRPLVAAVVNEVLANRQLLSGTDRLGYPESEAAALMGVPQHVLRDARLRQEITARKVGKRFVYSRSVLEKFLLERE